MSPEQPSIVAVLPSPDESSDREPLAVSCSWIATMVLCQVIAGGCMLLSLVSIVPHFVEYIFNNVDMGLPVNTHHVVAVANFTQAYWGALAASGLIVCAVLGKLRRGSRSARLAAEIGNGLSLTAYCAAIFWIAVCLAIPMQGLGIRLRDLGNPM